MSAPSTHTQVYSAAAILLLLAAVAAPAQERRPERRPAAAQERITRLRLANPQADLRRDFELSAEFGDREVLEFTIERPGQVVARAGWRGSAGSLALILNGPGQRGYYARQDGSSPLRLVFQVTEEVLRRGTEWKLSIVNFSRRGRAAGRVDLSYPTRVRRLMELTPDVRRLAETVQTLAPPPAGEPQRSILPDGRVQVRHPDGRTVIYNAGCGYTTIFPDGTAMHASCNQVQPATMPVPPSDPGTLAFLENHRDLLLGHIGRLVDHRQEEVDLYLAYEAENTDGLYEQIRLRTALISKLLPE